MNWSDLYNMQKQLDDYIEAEHELTDKDLFREKYLALLVELGELANETRCFKFWSNKPRSDKAVVLEEYVDGVHFLLSLGLEKGLQFSGAISRPVENSETEQFNQVFAACTNFNENPSTDNYEQLFESFLLLGNILGFNEQDIKDAYLKKNKTNYKRQNEGY
ncbi:dUTP diphosphatase [Virgibacillus kekensis]|uniref:dUTP diphosphatase n=1 Tax=Virgibacillus kekensis TaxID=202261 RepID=A0ABV9DEC4_9BACI